MRGFVAEPPATFGGPWTLEKLQILRAYLDAYTTALQKRTGRTLDNQVWDQMPNRSLYLTASASSRAAISSSDNPSTSPRT